MNPKEDAACAACAVSEFSGEEIIPFDDCETVKDARQRRVARILGAADPAHRAPLADAIEPPAQQGANGLPLEVRISTLEFKSSRCSLRDKCSAYLSIFIWQELSGLELKNWVKL